MTDTLDKLISDSFEAARTCKTCSKCQFSFLVPETGTGYCKYQGKRSNYMVPKYITEDSTCTHWKGKKKI